MNIKDQIAVMEHYANGGKVEVQVTNGWQDCVAPSWNWERWCFRIKKEPRRYKVMVTKPQREGANPYLVECTNFLPSVIHLYKKAGYDGPFEVIENVQE